MTTRPSDKRWISTKRIAVSHLGLLGPGQQRGLTLLEVLIALSIYALIGIASFQVLTTVAASQQLGDQHSQQLMALQKTLLIMDRDIGQFIDRSVRVSATEQAASLQLSEGDFALQITRGGWSNPLNKSRSSLQRVAYDIGPHPRASDKDSLFYQDQRSYLRRHYWTALDREDGTNTVIQPLLVDVDALSVAVFTDAGRQRSWPMTPPQQPIVVELSFNHQQLGMITRMIKVY